MIGKVRTIDAVLLIAIVAIVAYQSLYIFYYPQIDTGAWFGDESWTMLTLRQVGRTGVARIPEAIGSSIAESNGLINGVVWISGLIYGVPALIFSSASPVCVGRVITLALSIALLFTLYAVLKRASVARTLTLATLLAVVASPGFYFSSHSARMDMITALAVAMLLYVFCWMMEVRTRPAYLLTGAFVSLSLAVYVHVPTLVVLPWLYAIWRSKASVTDWVYSIAGAVISALILTGIYYTSAGDVALLGSGHNQYYSVVSALPVLHPFSWQVQKINTIDRFIQVWGTQWPIILLFIAGVLGLILKWAQVTQLQRALLAMSALVLIGWMAFEGPAVFYEIHATPAFAICTALGLSRFSIRPSWIGTVAILLAGLSMFHQRGYGEAGRVLSLNNQGALRSMLARVRAPERPIVLADQPAWNVVESTPGVQLMTSHLLLFGGEPRPVPDILRAHNVQYLLLYSTKQFQSPFRQIADSMYSVVDTKVGDLTDEAKSYDPSTWLVPDTVRVYKAKWLQ